MAQEKTPVAVDYSKLTPEELIAALQEKDQVIKSKDQEIADSAEYIGELKEEIAERDEEILTLSPLVKVGKDSYEIAIPSFNLYDEETREITKYTALDVQKDSELAAKLVKAKSGVLVKVEK